MRRRPLARNPPPGEYRAPRAQPAPACQGQTEAPCVKALASGSCDNLFVRNRSPNFRRGRYGTRKHGRRHARPPGPAPGGFSRQVIGTCVLVAVVAWTAEPRLTSIWTVFTTPPDQLAQLEQSVHYSNCDAARADGVAPLYRGSPGYRDRLDGDGDGIACEPYR